MLKGIIKVEKEIKKVSCVLVSVKLSVMCCGSVRNIMVELSNLQKKLGNGFDCFVALGCLGKSSFILGSELWEDYFDLLLALVTLSTFEKRVMTHPSLSLQLEVWGILLGSRSAVMLLCVREVSLTLVNLNFFYLSIYLSIYI